MAAGSGHGIFHWVSPASTGEASVPLKTLKILSQRYILINLTGYCSHSQCLHSIILHSASFCLIFTPQGSLCLTIQPRLRDILESEHPTQNSSWDMSGQALSRLGTSQCFFFSLSFHMAGTLRHTNHSDSPSLHSLGYDSKTCTIFKSIWSYLPALIILIILKVRTAF